MTTRVLVMTGGVYERGADAAFSVADLAEAIAYFEDRNPEFYTNVAEVWEGGTLLGMVYGVEDLKAGVFMPEGAGAEQPLVPNLRKRSSKRKR